MDYIEYMQPKDLMEFIDFVGLEPLGSRIAYIDKGEYKELTFFIKDKKYKEKEFLKIKFFNFFLLLEDNYEYFTAEEQKSFDMNYKYFMTYKFGNANKDYSPYKEDLLYFYTSLWGRAWKECENIQEESKSKKIKQKVSDEAQSIADQISQEMFMYKRNANAKFLNKKFNDDNISKYIFTDGYYFD